MTQSCLHRLLLRHRHQGGMLRVPLPRIDINTGPKADWLSGSGVGCNHSHVVAFETDCLVQQGTAIDDAEAVSLPRHECDVFMAAARVAWGGPGLLL